MHHLRSNRFACIAFALALAGCGGGANSSTPAVLPSAASGNTTSNAQSVAVTFSIVVPKAASAHTRRAQYVSTATATASIKVNSGTVQTGSCTSVSCVVTVNAPVGSDTFVVQLLDNTSDVLSQGSMSQTISGTAANTVTLAFDGVPSTVILTAATTHFVPGSLSSSSVITAVVKDAAGDTIIGTDPYVDSTGTTNPITLTTTNATDTSFSTTSLTSPATSTSTLTYTGASAAAGTTLSIGATATSITPTPATISVYAHHTILEYPVPGGGTPYGAALGADGNVWFVEEAVAKVGHVAPDGTITLYTIPSGGDGFAIAAGSDSRLWFTENNGKIGAVTTGGTVSEYTSGVSDPFGIAKGANGNMFYVDFSGSGLVGQITTSGSTSFSSGLSGGPQLQGIALGSDDRVWVTEPFGGTDQFVALDTSFNATYYNTTAGAQMRGITLGPSNNLWFCDSYNGNGGNNAIGKIHDDGTGFAEYAIPTSGGSCETITEGSDGLMYFTEINGNKIGVSTTGATPTITEYTIPTASSSPQGITTGTDGNIWFTELAGNKIGRYIL